MLLTTRALRKPCFSLWFLHPPPPDLPLGGFATLSSLILWDGGAEFCLGFADRNLTTFWGLLTWLTGTCSLFSGFADGNLPTFFGCADGNLQTVFGFADGDQCGALRAPVASKVAGVAGHDATLRTSVEL